MANRAYQPQIRQDDMFIEEFNEVEHLPLLMSWLVQRNLSPSMATNLPINGFVVYEKNEPISMVFLRLVEGRLGLCDGLCTNPQASSESRNLANDFIIQHLIEKARGLNMKSLIAWSVDMNTLERAFRHGFESMPNTLITYDLGGK